MARPDFPDDLGRRIATALSKAERGQLLPRQLTRTTVKNTLSAVPDRDPLQARVHQYYRGQGLLL